MADLWGREWPQGEKKISHKHLGFEGRYVSLNGPILYPRMPQCFFGSYASHYVYCIQ